MKKIDLGQTITILANIGVIAGIVFLGYELRQNTGAIKLEWLGQDADSRILQSQLELHGLPRRSVVPP